MIVKFILLIDTFVDEIPADSTSTNAKVNPGSLYYPWPSKAVSFPTFFQILRILIIFKSTS